MLHDARTGFGMMQGMTASNTIIQTLVPEDKRGRVMSYYTMAFVGMAPFGSLLAGALAHRIGAPHAIMITGTLLPRRSALVLHPPQVHPRHHSSHLYRDGYRAKSAGARNGRPRRQ